MSRGGTIGEEDFAAMFTAHYSAVLAYGARRVDAEIARDVAAETFLVAWRRLDAPPQSPRAWLLACARKVLANELRRRGRHDRLVGRVALILPTEPGATEAGDPGALAGAADEGAGVRRAMATLSARDQEVLALHGWEQLDGREIAVALECSAGAAKVRLHRARRRLVQAIADLPAEPPPAGEADEYASAPSMTKERS